MKTTAIRLTIRARQCSAGRWVPPGPSPWTSHSTSKKSPTQRRPRPSRNERRIPGLQNFELDPTLEPLFKSDIKEQGKIPMTMIHAAVRGLDDLDKPVPVVENPGRRHVGYGVKAEHCSTVATALLWTLEEGLGEAFTPEVKEAWTAVHTALAATMQQAPLSLCPSRCDRAHLLNQQSEPDNP